MTGLMFGLGVAAGAAMFGGWHWGYSGGGWGNSYTTVNVNRATSISANNFNADRYRNGQWNHDPAHRDGVPYRTPAERQEFGQHRPDAQQREQFRGQLDGRGNYTQRPGENRPAENRPRRTGRRRIAVSRTGPPAIAARSATSTVAAPVPAVTSSAAASPGATELGRRRR